MFAYYTLDNKFRPKNLKRVPNKIMYIVSLQKGRQKIEYIERNAFIKYRRCHDFVQIAFLKKNHCYPMICRSLSVLRGWPLEELESGGSEKNVVFAYFKYIFCLHLKH